MMAINKSGTISGSMNIQGGEVQMKLSVIMFEDGGCSVFYCPAVNVFGYGKTEMEASESLRVALGEFFTYTLHKKTLSSELNKLGWNTKKKNRPTPPAFSFLLDKNKILNKILNTRDFTKVDQSFNIPALS